MKTPPPPIWGEEESEYDFDEGEPFYNERADNGKDSRQNLHLDSWRQIKGKSMPRPESNDYEVREVEGVQTVIVKAKRPKGSKLKKKIVYVYDSDEEEEPEVKIPAGYRPNIMSLREG